MVLTPTSGRECLSAGGYCQSVRSRERTSAGRRPNSLRRIAELTLPPPSSAVPNFERWPSDETALARVSRRCVAAHLERLVEMTAGGPGLRCACAARSTASGVHEPVIVFCRLWMLAPLRPNSCAARTQVNVASRQSCPSPPCILRQPRRSGSPGPRRRGLRRRRQYPAAVQRVVQRRDDLIDGDLPVTTHVAVCAG